MPKTKRKSSGSDSENTGKRRKEREAEGDLQDASVFGELVTKAGMRLKSGHRPNEIMKDQAVFQRNLSKLLKKHPDFPQVAEEFTEALSNHIEDTTRFFWSVMPTCTASGAEASARGGNQDSLIRLLLGIDSLQPSIMNMLLEKLAEFTGDEEPVVDQNEKVNMPHLIMNQFRWLDRIINSKEITKKMLEIVCIVSVEAQREIITCIPEVVDDSDHATVAKELRDMFVDNQQLAVAILDALSNLTLKQDLLTEVRGSVMQTLSSVELDDLPVVVRFLLQTTTSADALQVISELRSHLDFQASFPPTDASTPNTTRTMRHRNASDTNVLRGNEALTLDAIRSGIRFQKTIAEAWIKAIEAGKSSADHKVVDMFVLLILHANSYKKPVESLLRNKIRAGHFTEVLLQATFGAHGQVLREYFPSVLAMAEVLLRSPEPLITYFGSAMYKHAFVAFDTYCQQEIVGNLVTHIGSGFSGEVDSSLDILADLVETNVTKMAPFAVFVKGVLDYLDNLSVCQIRKLYSMLSTLAFRNPTEEGVIQDELHIVIRKQLSNNDKRYKRMGVIGAIMVIKSMAYYCKVEPTIDQTNMEDQSVAISDDLYKQVVNLLQLVRSSVSRYPEAAALFMDELASVIHKGIIDPKVEAWVSDNVISDFQEDFVVDVVPNQNNQDHKLPMASQFGLDDEAEGAIAINLLPLVENDETRNRHVSGVVQNERQVSPLCLSPHFRLVQICEGRQQGGDLEGIDALLGCPVNIPEISQVDKLDSLSNQEKHLYCRNLFFTANWFREIINAFASQSDPEMKAKVITRLHNVTDINQVLQKALAATPGFYPSPANFDTEEVKAVSVTTTVTAHKNKAKKSRKGKKKKGAEKENLNEEEEEESVDSSVVLEKENELDKTQKDEDPVEKISVSLSQYSSFFRELDIEVFTILESGLITKAALDTEMNTTDTTTLQLQPVHLEFLLEDLVRKLEHALPASAAKRRTFLKGRGDKPSGFSHLDQLGAVEVSLRAVRLLPTLCTHLECTNTYFQSQIAANDGVVDGPGSNSEESQLIGRCFHLLLQALLTLMSWNGFVMEERRSILKEAIMVVACRTSETKATQAPLQQLLKEAFNYVENFSSTVPDLSTAVTLTRLMVILAEKSDSEILHAKIAKIAEGFLKREWYGPDGEREKGAKHNERLQQLLKLHFDHSEDVITSLDDVANLGVKELIQTDKSGCSQTYPTLTRQSFGVFYRMMLSELVSHVKAISPGKLTDSDDEKMERLIRWNMCVRVFHVLVSFIKVFDGRSNLGAIFKYGRQFVEVFLRLAMPLLDNMFSHHGDEVQSLLKNLQISTRSLHHMCGHSKIMKDITLTNQVPPLKKCLEAFVYRVKAMLTLNKCLEAFWMGNLKNRDLQGEEIVSQSTISESQAEESDADNDSVPEDDDDSDVEVGEGSSETTNQEAGSDSDSNHLGSYSETY